MARQKNALTKYFVGGIDEKEADLRLAKWIESVEDDSDEETEDIAFYDGDGTQETDVISIKKAYTFEGMHDADDEAQLFIAGLEFETGEGRKIWFKQERTDGTVLQGPATVSDIVVTGGEASEYAPFSCTIAWDRKPTITKDGATSSGDGQTQGTGTED